MPEGIILLGVVKNPYPYYSAADIVVLPSRIDPFPFVMLEAGLMRKPFIGSRTGGIAEFIEDGKDGLLTIPEDVIDLKNKIGYLINTPQKAKTLAENLYQKVKSQTSREKYISRLCKIYDELLMEK